jgi:hypothetical protein
MGKNLWLYFAAVALISCHHNSALVKKAGIDFNSKRKTLGLPLLPKNWTLVKNRGGYFEWMPLHNPDSLVFSSKQVRVKNDKLYSEGNVFFGGKKYHTIDGDFFEELSISCDFDKDGNVSKWNCSYRTSEYKFNGLDIPFDKPVTKHQADSIISNWGLAYVQK